MKLDMFRDPERLAPEVHERVAAATRRLVTAPLSRKKTDDSEIAPTDAGDSSAQQD